MLGLCRLLWWHSMQIHKAIASNDVHRFSWSFLGRCSGASLCIPKYLSRGTELTSLLLTLDLMGMLATEPMIHCMGDANEIVQARIFLYLFLILELGHVSVALSEYRVLCLRAIKQIVLCLGAVFVAVLVFAFGITAMGLTMTQPMNHQFENVGTAMNTLTQMSLGIMDLTELHEISEENPTLLVMLGIFMVVVYSFFFNLLVSQFCGVYASLASDVTGYARLARGEIIVDLLKEPPSRCKPAK
eukprot:Skav206259  [mRNA]  locus=scaffold265:1550:5469:- [translate_table: standard]